MKNRIPDCIQLILIKEIMVAEISELDRKKLIMILIKPTMSKSIDNPSLSNHRAVSLLISIEEAGIKYNTD